MVKKRILIKKTPSIKAVKKIPRIVPPIKTTEKILVDNFIALQKVMVNLSIKFDGLNNQISKLLELFEISAKALAEKENIGGDVEKKLDNLLDQNKTLAKGVSLLHQAPRQISPPQGQMLQPRTNPQQLPPNPQRFNPLSKQRSIETSNQN